MRVNSVKRDSYCDPRSVVRPRSLIQPFCESLGFLRRQPQYVLLSNFQLKKCEFLTNRFINALVTLLVQNAGRFLCQA
jgi:hypothetical protein